MVIGFNDSTDIKKHLETFYCLLQSFYNANKLIINADKIKFTVNCKPKRKSIYENLTFKAGSFTIATKPSIKLLGMIVNHDLKVVKHLGILLGQL